MKVDDSVRMVSVVQDKLLLAPPTTLVQPGDVGSFAVRVRKGTRKVSSAMDVF